MGRAPCCEKVGLKKGPWTPEEDNKLIAFITEHGHGSWRALPKKAGLLRCGKSCRLRWTNYLRPDIKRGEFSQSEEQTIIQLHALLGNRWSAIASHLPKRTDNEIKNYWNTHLKKRLLKMGIDPATHKPKPESTSSLLETNATSANSALSHMAQWESARLEAEARLARESKMRAKGLWVSTSMVTPNVSSSAVRSWNSQAPDLSSQSPLPSKAISAMELMNSLQNWEKSLQGQAGLMWPDSWTCTSVADGQDSSCCSSPQTSTMDHGSPTSTLCSLEAHLQNAALHASSANDSCLVRKLSWMDNSVSKEMVAPKSEPFPFLDIGKPPQLAQVSQVDDLFPAGVSGSLDGDSIPSLLSLQDLDFPAAARVDAAITTSCATSSMWSQSSTDFSMDVCKTDSESIPALASATTSSGLLGELEMVSEDISSNSKSSSVGCGEVSPEFVEFSLHRETSCGTARPNTFSALLTEDSPEYWSNMLKQIVDTPVEHEGAEAIPF